MFMPSVVLRVTAISSGAALRNSAALDATSSRDPKLWCTGSPSNWRMQALTASITMRGVAPTLPQLRWDQAGIEEELLTNAFPQGLLCRKGLNIVLQVFELVGKGAGYFGQDAGCRQRGGQGFYKGASFHRVCVIINIDNAHSADKKRPVRLRGK